MTSLILASIGLYFFWMLLLALFLSPDVIGTPYVWLVYNFLLDTTLTTISLLQILVFEVKKKSPDSSLPTSVSI
jgi:small-conductance mechanosensitive channel